MNADAITTKILEDAREGAAAILREAREKITAIRKDADADAEKRKDAMRAQNEAHVAELRDRMLRMAELDQRKALLAAKRTLIDEAFADALARLRAMPDAQKRAYLTKLLLDASESGETLIADADEAVLYDAAFVGHLNDALKAAGKPAVVYGGQTRPLGGGFVLQTEGMEINCTYQAVLAQARPALEASVANMLFGAIKE